MNEDNGLFGFLLACIPLSLLSFGGGHAIIAGLQYQTVEVNHLLSAQEFTELFAISKIAPGPTTQIVALIGWQIAGLLGAFLASLAIFVPSSIVMGVVGRLWERRRASRWTVAIEQGLLPVAVGLMAAGVFSVLRVANLRIADFLVLGATILILRFTKIGPYPVLGGVALLYLGVAALLPLMG